MRKFFIVLCCVFLVSLICSAQQTRTGNITGIVVDQEGNPLPGVAMTLTGPTIAPMTAQTSAEGKYRFLSLFPGNDYIIKAELQGFKTKIEKGVIVNIGANSEIKVQMEQGALEEQVTVVAQTPVVQAKKTQVTHTVNYEMLQSLPSARDPWVVLQLTPGIFIDRENVGGSESGQQSSFSTKGSTTQEWTLDGIQITDLSSGGSPGYYDFDAFEEMNVSTGMLDVEHRSPGTVINLVTRRGGNQMSMAGRFYLTDEKFQGRVTPGRLTDLGVAGYNKIVDIKDFGFNVGGPVFKDKVWWWGSYGVQQIWAATPTNPNDKTLLTNLDAKLNLQIIPENRAEFYVQAGKKEKFGRSSSLSYPSGWDQVGKYHFGSPTIAFRDEHAFGDSLYASVRYGFTDAGFGMWPANDRDMKNLSWYDYTKALWNGGQTWWFSDRPHHFGVAQLQYYNDDLFGTGTSHEMKIGFEINNNAAKAMGYEFGGNFYYYGNYYQPTVDWNLDGKQDIVNTLGLSWGGDIRRLYFERQDIVSPTGTNRISAYFNDTISFGRFNINLGIRWDRAKSYYDPMTYRAIWDQDTDLRSRENYYEIVTKYLAPNVISNLKKLLPDKSRGAVEPGKLYDMFSPRIGINYDLFGNGKTILKVAGSLFPGGGLGPGYWSQSGLGGSMNFWWADINKNTFVELDELYWANYQVATRPVYRAFDDAGNFVGNYAREFGLHWSGWTWDKPLDLVPNYTTVDLDNWKTDLTWEAFGSIEHELMKDFGVSLSYTWRRFGRWSWSQAYYPEAYFPGLNNHIRTQDDYMLAGNVPSTITMGGKTFDMKEAAGKPWYVLKNLPETASTSYSYLTMYPPGRYNIYWGADLVFTKRLSNRWMFNGSVTYQMQRSYYGDKGYMDPTGMWAYEGSIYGQSLGGNSGKTGVNFFSRWMVKMAGLYQLPWDAAVSATVSGHEGAFVGESFSIQDQTLPNPRSTSNGMPTMKYDNRNRLPDVWTVNFKLEKMLKITDTARMWFAIDYFNIFDQTPVLRQYDNSYGTFRINDNVYTAPGATNNKPIEIMNPYVFRFGVRFQI